MAAKCQAIARSGSRCGSPVLPGRAHCLMHDPASAEARREASRKGGKARSHKARAAKLVPEALTADEVAGWLSLVFTATLSGTLEPKIATACATVARTLLEASAVADQPRVEELQEQLATLRTMIERGRVA
jgi:hypothetical protein